MHTMNGQTGQTGQTSYIALLRGINVGGHRLIKMADLKALFAAMSFGEARTYIQSGNVVFRAAEPEQPLRQRLEQQIEATFGFAVTVALRTAEEMAAVVASSPFPPDAQPDGASLYVALLTDAPSAQGIERLRAATVAPDEYRIHGREVYLLYQQTMRDTQLTNALLENRLGVAATSRNWRTITTLAALANEPDVN